MERVLRRLAMGVTRRPVSVLAATAFLALGGAALALLLEPSAATETLVNQGSDTFKDTERFKKDFGDEAILVLVHGELTRTVLTSDLGRLIQLEGCLSGNVPDTKRGLGTLPPVCREIAELDPARVVYGPGTFVNTAVRQIGDQFGKEQRRAAVQGQKAAAAALETARGPAGGAGAARTRGSGRGQRQVRRGHRAARSALRADRRPANQRPELRVGARVRPDRRQAGRAQVALRVPVPVEERRPDPDPAAAGPHRP